MREAEQGKSEGQETPQETSEQKQAKGSKLMVYSAVSLVIALVAGLYIGSNFIPNTGLLTAGGSLCETNVSNASFSAADKAELRQSVEDYLNNEYIPKVIGSGSLAVKVNSVEDYGEALYVASVDILESGETTDSTEFYITKDGKSMYFTPPIDLEEEIPETQQPEQETLSCSDIPKSDEAVLQAFVVSYCPYGLQAQRALIPVARLLGLDSVKIRYIGSVANGQVQAMHGETEAAENHRQICLREEQPERFLDYLSCFIQEGNTGACLGEAGIDEAELTACMSDAERGLKYASEDFDKANSFGIGGSPSFVVNGEIVSEFAFAGAQGNNGRSPENLKQLLCCAFNTEPDACSTEMQAENSATGFSTAASGNGTGSC